MYVGGGGVGGGITGKFHQNPLKTVGGVAETRLCLPTDGRTEGRTHYYSPLQLMSGNKKGSTLCIFMEYAQKLIRSYKH